MANRRAWGRPQFRVQPDGKIRQSQVVGTYGPGAMVDLVDDAVLVGGLDFWRFDGGRTRSIDEQRLRDVLAEKLAVHNRPLRMENAFLLPPTGDDKDPTRRAGIQVLEFPHWFVCQNPRCRALVRSSSLERRAGKYVHACERSRETQSVPVRFVAACKRGHLEDFPWVSFVHEDKQRCAAPSLRLMEGATGDFAEVEAVCACGARRRMSNATVPEANPRCGGERPWLGREGREECSERLRLLVRTASNSYFSQVVSALSIPEQQHKLVDDVKSQWETLKSATGATLPAFRTIEKINQVLKEHSDEEVLRAIEQIKSGAPIERERLRTAEFNQLMAARPEAPGDLPEAGATFFARTASLGKAHPNGIGRVVLAHKLREVRVQVGFTRIEAATADLQGEFDLGVEASPLGLLTDWLPASEVLGEGIFIQLDEKLLLEWETRKPVIARGRDLLRGYEEWSKLSASPPPFPGVRFYLLHSLSHLLVSALSLECGYAASAIHERIYCAPTEDTTPMAAILLSTGSPGTEGTLGGLVEQGRRLRHHLRHAFDLGRLCSNDPVCASHTPAGDLVERHLEGAACHGCLFVAECSCERFNRYLDRALVVPTIGHDPQTAFFAERP